MYEDTRVVVGSANNTTYYYAVNTNKTLEAHKPKKAQGIIYKIQSIRLNTALVGHL
jgi:hypothetical protein